MKILVTGSSGLIGSEVCCYFSNQGHQIHGIDNNQRAVFFGPQGDTSWRLKELKDSLPSFSHHELDIRDRSKILEIIKEIKPDAIVHTAAQPSHDKAASIPFDDFDVNAGGTLNLLEACRQVCPDSPFVHMSTNKVYGDGPNSIKLKELESRWEYDDPDFASGIPETFSIDQCKHSLFGASKVAADVMVQEYGRYFGMATCCLRGGCLTGPSHSGVELHGFLSYLVKCNLEEKPTTYSDTKVNRFAIISTPRMLLSLSNFSCRLRDLGRFIIWEAEKQIVARFWKLFKFVKSFQAKNKNMNIWSRIE